MGARSPNGAGFKCTLRVERTQAWHSSHWSEQARKVWANKPGIKSGQKNPLPWEVNAGSCEYKLWVTWQETLLRQKESMFSFKWLNLVEHSSRKILPSEHFFPILKEFQDEICFLKENTYINSFPSRHICGLRTPKWHKIRYLPQLLHLHG